MKQITVACTKRDTEMFTAQKYDNNEAWNVPGGTAPSGVHATRYLRKTSPDINRLTPLARFLAENVPGCVAGTMPHPRIEARVTCYNGKTVAEQNNWTENQKRVWAPEGDKPAHIDDWLFSIIEPDQSDEEYWNMEAIKIRATGITRITIGTDEWRA